MSLIKITNDMFNISKRVKSIDPYYYIVYNTKTNQYELHHSKQKFTTFCLNLGNILSAKVIRKILKTKHTNFSKLLQEIETNNLAIKAKADELIFDKAKTRLKSYTDYLNKSSKTISFDKLD